MLRQSAVRPLARRRTKARKRRERATTWAAGRRCKPSGRGKQTRTGDVDGRESVVVSARVPAEGEGSDKAFIQCITPWALPEVSGEESLVSRAIFR